MPDLVATDFMMPRMNGGELIARLRRNPASAAIPIILVSASPGSERRTEADAFFRKPFDPDALTQCAAQLLETQPVMERLSTGDPRSRSGARRRPPGRFVDHRCGAAGQREDDPRPADVLHERDLRAEGRLLHDLVGAARQDGAGISSRSASSTSTRSAIESSSSTLRSRSAATGPAVSRRPPTRSCAAASRRSP